MDTRLIGLLIGDLVLILLGNITLIASYKEWKKTKNQMDFSVMFLLFSYGLLIAYGIISNFITGYNNTIEFQVLIYKNITLDLLLLLVVIFIYGWFLLFLLNLKKLYIVLSVLLYFGLAYYATTGNFGWILLYILIFFVGNSGFLFFYSLSKKNGLIFGISLFAIGSTISQFIDQYSLLSYILLAFALVSLYLGIRNVFDRKLFGNKEEMSAIQNTWLASRIKKEKRKEKLQPMKILVLCPICQTEGQTEIPEDVILARKNSKKGLFVFEIGPDFLCEHEFKVFLDRNFQIKGYDFN